MTLLRSRILRRAWVIRTGMLLGILGVSFATASAADAFRIPRELSGEERAKIDSALPPKALAAPARPRKLLIFDLNVGYPGHGSIAHANYAFSAMGQRTGAFEATVNRDPSVFAAESLKQYDAVFLNNTVGNMFQDATLRQNLLEFVVGGADCWAYMARASPSPTGPAPKRTGRSSA